MFQCGHTVWVAVLDALSLCLEIVLPQPLELNVADLIV